LQKICRSCKKTDK